MRDFTSLEAGLSLMPGLPPDEVARLLTQRAERLRMELRTIDAAHEVAAESGLPELFLVESHYRRHMLQAELDFVIALAKDIRSSALRNKAWRRMHELREEGLSYQEILADPVGHLGEEARALTLDPYS